VADNKGSVRRGLPAGQGGVAGDSPLRHVDGRAKKNGGVVEFGRRWGAPVGDGGLRVDLR
jgi:hypothetical protein